jgi:hypothetical protein
VDDRPLNTDGFELEVFYRRQYRFGDFNVGSRDRAFFGRLPKGLLHVGDTGVTLTKIRWLGQSSPGTSQWPTSWTWRYHDILTVQSIVLTWIGWGQQINQRTTPHGIRLDIKGGTFYPLIATPAIGQVVRALESHGVAVDPSPKKLNTFLIGRK